MGGDTAFSGGGAGTDSAATLMTIETANSLHTANTAGTASTAPYHVPHTSTTTTTNATSATSTTQPMSIPKLGQMKNPAFRGSAPFLSTYGPTNPIDTSADNTESVKTGLSTSVSASSSHINIPTPIKIPNNAFFASGSNHSTPSNMNSAVEHNMFMLHGVHSPPDQTPPQLLNKQISQTYTHPAYSTHTTHPAYTDNNTSTFSVPSSPHLPARRALDTQSAQLNHLDLSFIQLFNEAKSEVVKLLRDDKFPRWKQTPEFAQFISTIKPYEQEVVSGNGTRRSVNMSHMENSMNE